MLTSLHIENIAVIERTDITLSDGFNILTGETGAGKSIVIDAINAVLGERTSRELVRTGTSGAKVSALFENVCKSVLDTASELGFDSEDGSLLLQRTISSDGKGAFRINGMPATASILREIGRGLINIHGQHDSQALLNPEMHMGFVDAMADDARLLEEYAGEYRRMCDIRAEFNRLAAGEADKQERADLLAYQINELEAAKIRPGERDELTARRDLIRNSESIAESLSDTYSILNGSDNSLGAAYMLSDAAKKLAEAAEYSEQTAALAEKLSGFYYEIEDISSEIHSLLDGTDFSPDELDEIEQRLDTIYRLSQKYGKTEEDMLAFLDKAKSDLNSIEHSDEHLTGLKERYRQAKSRASELAQRLSEVRRQAADRLAAGVCDSLEFLDMSGVKFIVNIEQIPLSPTGTDKIEFLISTNPGEPAKPLQKIASGGELSRIMLAIKSILADKDNVDTLIFDEVDTGISGRAAGKVGISLRRTSRYKQVVCVTHLAQIAALADNHFKIEKHVSGGRTFTEVTPLDYSGRIEEVARIMSTGEITDAMRTSAKELIDGRNKM